MKTANKITFFGTVFFLSELARLVVAYVPSLPLLTLLTITISVSSAALLLFYTAIWKGHLITKLLIVGLTTGWITFNIYIIFLPDL